MIRAGAVVKTDVPDYAAVAGVPAKQIGWSCKCGTTLRFNNGNEDNCNYCGNEYKLRDGNLTTHKQRNSNKRVFSTSYSTFTDERRHDVCG